MPATTWRQRADLMVLGVLLAGGLAAWQASRAATALGFGPEVEPPASEASTMASESGAPQGRRARSTTTGSPLRAFPSGQVRRPGASASAPTTPGPAGHEGVTDRSSSIATGLAPASRRMQTPITVVQTVQRTGSAALNLAYVAAGRIEAYAELHINAWDCAAGILLVQEAGGHCNDFFTADGAGVRDGNVLVATNHALAATLEPVIGIARLT